MKITNHANKCKRKTHENDPDPEAGTCCECTCDGYHTFDELYDHRITLYIALCKMMSKHASGGDSYVWYSLLHSDGSSIPGWFVLGINDNKTQQITYHLPIERLSEVSSFACECDKAPEYDGHTSDDVLLRLKNI